MASHPPRFNSDTLKFIEKASHQKKPEWLDKNREDYEHLVQEPLQYLAKTLKAKLAAQAPGYHFPQKGIGRLKRSANRVKEYGSAFKGHLSYQASRPSGSRFDHNPNLFFLVHPKDEDGDQVLVAGGLYMPSSRQVRAIREAIAKDPAPFEKLFKSKSFASHFSEGFSNERISSRIPRGFDPSHPRMDWIRLQAFFVWRPYSRSEWSSKNFAEIVVGDWAQILKLNALLEQAIEGRWNHASSSTPSRKKSVPLPSLLEEIEAPRREMDF
jgi:uncharacterized protein (TIGR02453 family)